MVQLVIHGKNQELGHKNISAGEAIDILKLVKEVDCFYFDGITLDYTGSTCTIGRDVEEFTEVRIFGGETSE